MAEPTHKCPRCGSVEVAVDGTTDYLVNVNTGHAIDGTGGNIIWTASGFIQCRECPNSADDADDWKVGHYEPPKRSPQWEAVRTVARNPWAWPGGYPVVLIMADGELVCSQCVKGNYRLILEATRDGHVDAWGNCHAGPDSEQWTAAGHQVLEGTAEDWHSTICANCGADVLETEATPGAHSCRYVVEYVPNGNETPETRTLTRAEALDRLEGWVKDPSAALDDLDRQPGTQQRLTAFAYYSAEPVKS